MKKGPQFVEYFGPILDALRELGNSARPMEVEDWIASNLNVPTEMLDAESGSLGALLFSQSGSYRLFRQRCVASYR